MKIRKVYESDENESYEKIDIFDYFNKKFIIDKTRNKILNLMNEYIKINSKYFLDKYLLKSDKEFVVDIELEEPFKFYFYNQYKNFYELETDDFNDFLNFLEDPEAYKNTKKFNI